MQGGWVEKIRTKSSISERSENSLIFDKLVVEGEPRNGWLTYCRSNRTAIIVQRPRRLSPPYAKPRVV